MSPKSFGGPLLATFLTAVLVCITILGGCPVAQTPGQLSTEPNQTTTVSGPTGPSLPGGDRPVTLPVPDQQQTSGTTGPTGATGATGSTTPASPANSVFLRVSEPAASQVLRPGASVTVDFFLSLGPGTTLSGTELVVARDDNQDGVPDGNPVLSRSITAAAGNNSVTFNTQETVDQGLLTHGLGRFVLGVRLTTGDGTQVLRYASGTISVDSIPPTATWISPTTDNLLNRDPNWAVTITTHDTSPVTLTILLDPDLVPLNGNEVQFAQMVLQPDPNSGTVTKTVNLPLSTFPVGTYYYYYSVTDGIPPVASGYAPNPTTGGFARLTLTDRLASTFNLSTLTDPNANPSKGAILQGVNFNDLAGSSMASVPSLNGDGNDELVIVSRFGKPYGAYAPTTGVGFGEAYLLYGSSQRLHGIIKLNTTGVGLPGLIFPGIRTPVNVNSSGNASLGWTAGMSDVTVIPDMDGDNLPELAFSFPRVESVCLKETAPEVQLPQLVPDDIQGSMGELEYDAFYGSTPAWHPNEAQFTRGGVVIVSSHNQMLTNPAAYSRRSDRVMDLHEVGQLFDSMSRPGLMPYVAWASAIYNGTGPCGAADLPSGVATNSCFDCDPNKGGGCSGDPNALEEATVSAWCLQWDVVFDNQGPGGFLRDKSFISVNPPLANVSGWPFQPSFYFDYYDRLLDPAATPNITALRCPYMPTADNVCHVKNTWYVWGFCMGGVPFPGGGTGTAPSTANSCDFASWADGATVGSSTTSMWTGFYGPASTPLMYHQTGAVFPAPVGARVLGQKVDDYFGSAISSDGTWLYISSPYRTANGAPYSNDVPGLPSARNQSGVVYQLRTDARLAAGDKTRTQLWIEPGRTWPNVDAELVRADYTMPVPHNYVIQAVGSVRGRSDDNIFGLEDISYGTACPPVVAAGAGTLASNIDRYIQNNQTFLYPPGTAGYYMSHTTQIVGPHDLAQISFVRSIGDVNGDGIPDVAVGSENVRSTFSNPATVVGGVFIVYGRPPGTEGSILLEKIALDPTNPDRRDGVFIHGDSTTGDRVARVFAGVGKFDSVTKLTRKDFNGDGYADLVIGNEAWTNGSAANAGEVILVYGAPDLLSPTGGWTPSTIDPNRSIRFAGKTANELVGANVAYAGDVDGDGYGDILIAAPGDNGGVGAVYLVYGKPGLENLPQPIILADKIGTVDLPGAKFIGRAGGDYVGGQPAGGLTVNNIDPTGNHVNVFSQGVAGLGDINGDGLDDFALSAMLASPNGKTHAGEVYIIYGRGDPH